MSYTRVKFEQTHIIRPASCGTFRHFAQTFRGDPSSGSHHSSLFDALVHYDTNAVYTPKPLLSSHFSVFCRNKFYFRFVFERPVACSRLLSKYLIFLFCTFLFITPLCNLSIFALAPGGITFPLPRRKRRGRRTERRAAALSYYTECSLVQIIPQQLCAAGVAQLAQRLCFDLTHPLPGHVEFLAKALRKLRQCRPFH